MKKYKQFHKELTIPLEETEFPRLILMFVFAAIGVSSLFIKAAFPLGIVFSLVTGCASVAYLRIRRCLQELLVLQDRIQVYSRGGKLKRDVCFSNVKIAHQKIVWSKIYASEAKCDALILYRNMELYDGMILKEYLNDKNILIITNREAIAAIEEQLGLREKQFQETPVRNCYHAEAIFEDTTANITHPQKQYSLLKEDVSSPQPISKKFTLFYIFLFCEPILLSFIDVIYLLMLIPLSLLAAILIFLHYSYILYQRYAVVTHDKISVYSRNGKQLRDFSFDEIKAVKRFFYAEGLTFAREEECLIIYCCTTLPTKEKFSEYWNNRDILYISNPKLIELLESYLPPEQIIRK